jgi:hypothetical protein
LDAGTYSYSLEQLFQQLKSAIIADDGQRVVEEALSQPFCGESTPEIDEETKRELLDALAKYQPKDGRRRRYGDDDALVKALEQFADMCELCSAEYWDRT